MSDSRRKRTNTKEDRIKELKAEVAKLEAETQKPRKSKRERQTEKAAEMLSSFDNGEIALCKTLGKAGKLELKTKAEIASAAKLQEAGLVHLFGDAEGKLYAKPKTYWYGVAMGDLK